MSEPQRYLHNTLHSIDEKIIKWCLAEAEKQVVTNIGSRSGAYDLTAILTVVCTEVLELTDGAAEATKFFDKIKNKFHKHRAFQSELKRVKQ